MAIKVLYINEVEQIAGAETWFLSFLDGLAAAGLLDTEIEPVLLAPPGPFSDAARRKGARTIPYFFRPFNISSGRILNYCLYAAFRLTDSIRIARVIRDEKIDIVQSLNTAGHVVTGFLNRFGKVKTVWHVHGQKHPGLYRYFRPDHIVFVGHYRSRILQHLGLKKTRAHSVVYNGIDTKLYQTEKKPAEVTRLSFAGRIIPTKGIDILIEAAAILLKKRDNLVFNIFGEEFNDGGTEQGYTDELKLRTDELGISDKVLFRGFVFPPEKIYEETDILLFPTSHEEQCPMVILESWAAGVPVIASDTGGIPDILRDSENGLMVPQKNPEALAAAVEKLLDHPDEVERLAKNALKEVREKYDLVNHSRNFVDLYRKILNER